VDAPTSTYQWPALSAATSQLGPFPVDGSGILWPPRLIVAFTVNRTVALPSPADSAETARNPLTVTRGLPSAPPRPDLAHDRCDGSTVATTAGGSLLPSAVQNAATACSAASAWAGVSVPVTFGGFGPLEPLEMTLFPADPAICDRLATCDAGGAVTRTGTPKS